MAESTIYAIDPGLLEDSFRQVREAVRSSLPAEHLAQIEAAAQEFRESVLDRFGEKANDEANIDMMIPMPGFSEGLPNVDPVVREIEHIVSIAADAPTVFNHLHGLAHVLPVGGCTEQLGIFSFMFATAFLAGFRARDRQQSDIKELERLHGLDLDEAPPASVSGTLE